MIYNFCLNTSWCAEYQTTYKEKQSDICSESQISPAVNISSVVWDQVAIQKLKDQDI